MVIVSTTSRTVIFTHNNFTNNGGVAWVVLACSGATVRNAVVAHREEAVPAAATGGINFLLFKN
jgi:hypothetical protein